VVDNQINPSTATLRLKATFDNGKRALWPNQFVKARLYLRTREGAVTVPTPAVQRGPQGTFVYVVGADDVAQTRDVEVGTTQGSLTLISKGLEKGERVVTDGIGQLKPGAKVSVRGAGEGDSKGEGKKERHAKAGGSEGTGGGSPPTAGSAP
jgi:multidrug efflux system membrane fusion protein